MNLVQINERLKGLPMQVIQQYANGMNPEVPPYLALGELQRRELSQKQMATAQGAQQGPQPSVKEQVEQKAGLMALQQMQQQQMAQQQAQPRGPMPAPEGVPQPEQQPQAPQPQAMMARGGLAGIPVRRDMFEYAGGGIIAFQSGGQPKKYETPYDRMNRMNREKATGEPRVINLPKGTPADEVELIRLQNPDAVVRTEDEGSKLRDIGQAVKRGLTYSSDVEAMKQRAAPKPAPVEQAMLRQMDNQMMPAGLPAAAQERGAAPTAASRPPAAPMPSAPSRSGPPAAAMPTPPMPQGTPSAPMPQAGLPAAAQSVNPYEARLNQVALKEPVAPTTQDAISRVNELSPAAMQEAALQKRNQEMRDRASSYKEQFEKSRPSGLDDLIRVFGQAGQYKGLSGMAPAYTANKQQQRAEELAMTKQYNELMNLADTKELEGSRELFGARTKAFDTAQQLFGKEKDNVVKATASLYETTQGRINNELKMLSDKEIQNLRMAQETKMKEMDIGQRELERKSLNARDPNALVAQYVGLKAKARQLREQGKTAEADRLEAQAADMMAFKGGSGTAGVGAGRNAIMERRQTMQELQQIIKDEGMVYTDAQKADAARQYQRLAMQNVNEGEGGAPKVMTQADVLATAKSSGKTPQQVIDAAKARGFTIQ
jgi:hypothetical protein